MYAEYIQDSHPQEPVEPLTPTLDSMAVRQLTGAAKAKADAKAAREAAAAAAEDNAPLVPKSKEEQKAELQRRLQALDSDTGAEEAPKPKRTRTRKPSTPAEVQAEIDKANEEARVEAEKVPAFVDGDSDEDERPPPLRTVLKAKATPKARPSTPAGSVAGDEPVLLEVGAAPLVEAPLLEVGDESSASAVPDLADFPVERLKVHKNRDFYNLSMMPGRPRFILPQSPIVAVNLYENYNYAKVTVQLSTEVAAQFDVIDRKTGIEFQQKCAVPWARQLLKKPHLTLRINLLEAPRKQAAALCRLIGTKKAEPQEGENLTTWFNQKVQKYEHLSVGGEVELASVSVKEQGASLAMPSFNAAIFWVLNEAPEGLLPVEETSSFVPRPNSYMQNLMSRCH
jgi:hypothetical protein